MPFIRLSDDYVDHPKFRVLSDGAFRLWHHAMAYCRKYQTDGLIPMMTVRTLRPYSLKRARELTTPYEPTAKALWIVVEDFGYRVHDYLFWNLSKEEEQGDRDAATARMRRLRQTRRNALCSHEQLGERSPDVPGMDRIGTELYLEKGSGEKPTPNGRSKRPIFTGQRLTVFEWMLDNFAQILGTHTDAFDLHSWFFDLDAFAAKSDLVIPKRDNGAWLEAQLVAEARRRGLPVAIGAVSKPLAVGTTESMTDGVRAILKRQGVLP